MKTISKLVATAAMTVVSIVPSIAQTNLGASCGCPPVGSRSTVLVSTLADAGGGATDGDLLGNTIFTCDKTYILDKKIYVPDGKSLTIQAGTLVKGRTGGVNNANALIVTRGGQIFANGTQDCPIVFTAEADPMNGTYGVNNKGQWGGVVLLGKAKNNLIVGNVLSDGVNNGVGFVEGFTSATARNLYGMPTGQEDDNDNSGIMTYVSIRHAGESVGADNELNGLTCASVGRGTTLRHIEVISNFDDGIEFFGGTVDLKYATIMFNADDGFDWDQGWTGRAQFLFKLQLTGTGDNGFECDGDDDKTNALPRSHPHIYNATVLGNGGDQGLELKEITEGEIYNSVIAGFGGGMNLQKALGTRTGGVEAYHNWINGSLKVNNCTFVGATNYLHVDGGTTNRLPSDTVKFFADGNVKATSIPGLDYSFVMDGSTNVVTDQYNATPSPLLSSSITPPANGFFSQVAYRGAFEVGKKSWLSDYSMAALLDLANGLVPCATDINGDGSTNNVDFLQLLGQFNQSCD